ncbi:hypothetical protein [Ruegeria arenilitoris]|uniref:hypothetical protein n=1 Tax=Ruegeria arenilitoris TaxID=1173585 RepID=UPI001595D748|nr:hypothetical protein [Ruegeria arenilitoris]
MVLVPDFAFDEMVGGCSITFPEAANSGGALEGFAGTGESVGLHRSRAGRTPEHDI